MKTGISWGVPSLDLWKCINHRKLSSEIISRDSKGSPECWCAWTAHVAPFHTPWTHQPLFTSQFTILKLLCREMLCENSVKNNGCVKQKKLGKFPKILTGKKEAILEKLPIWITGALEVKQRVLCWHLSLPILLRCSTTNAAYRKQRKGRNSGQKQHLPW